MVSIDRAAKATQLGIVGLKADLADPPAGHGGTGHKLDPNHVMTEFVRDMLMVGVGGVLVVVVYGAESWLLVEGTVSFLIDVGLTEGRWVGNGRTTRTAGATAAVVAYRAESVCSGDEVGALALAARPDVGHRDGWEGSYGGLKERRVGG